MGPSPRCHGLRIMVDRVEDIGKYRGGHREARTTDCVTDPRGPRPS
ncbi:hypothetical protein Ae505Ps2_4344 [Pseudonocardia sp. Ae505_Ps2]|nr:hypothetical protein Ae505Ps2_4344 [Pseudonocardia sp. Ae505_Ps2]